MADDVTPVMYRVWRNTYGGPGDVFALFPTLPADSGGRYCTSYQHVGQHSAADYRHCIDTSRPALASEWAALDAELRGLGYNPLPVLRRTAAHRKVFTAQIMEWRKLGV